MTESSTKKKNLFYMIILILTLITMIIGVTLAYFKLIASQKEEGTVLYTGTLQITYVNGTYIEHPDLYPMNNVTYNTYNDVYRNTFSVVSTGTLDQTIWIDMEIATNEFNPNSLKYAVFNSKGAELLRGYVPKSGKANLANNIFLAHDATATYTLIIWWQDGNYQLKTEMGSVITGRIEVDAKQIRY